MVSALGDISGFDLLLNENKDLVMVNEKKFMNFLWTASKDIDLIIKQFQKDDNILNILLSTW